MSVRQVRSLLGGKGCVVSSSTHRSFHSFLAVATALGLAVALSLPVSAQSPVISLSPTAGPPTRTVAVTGTEFGATELVSIAFDGTQVGAASTDPSGAFQGSFDTPSSALPGIHEVTATGETSGISAEAGFKVRTNWAGFRFGDHHHGYNPYENVLSPSNVGALHVKWTAAIGNVVYSSPAVVDGTAFVGSANNRIVAIRVSTGTVKWVYSTGQPVYSSPAVAHGRVFVGSDDGEVYALSASTGELVWAHPTGDIVYFSSPAIKYGAVYIGSDDGNVYALDESTGAKSGPTRLGARSNPPRRLRTGSCTSGPTTRTSTL